jgi:hypothetical protein
MASRARPKATRGSRGARKGPLAIWRRPNRHSAVAARIRRLSSATRSAGSANTASNDPPATSATTSVRRSARYATGGPTARRFFAKVYADGLEVGADGIPAHRCQLLTIPGGMNLAPTELVPSCTHRREHGHQHFRSASGRDHRQSVEPTIPRVRRGHHRRIRIQEDGREGRRPVAGTSGDKPGHLAEHVRGTVLGFEPLPGHTMFGLHADGRTDADEVLDDAPSAGAMSVPAHTDVDERGAVTQVADHGGPHRSQVGRTGQHGVGMSRRTIVHHALTSRSHEGPSSDRPAN